MDETRNVVVRAVLDGFDNVKTIKGQYDHVVVSGTSGGENKSIVYFRDGSAKVPGTIVSAAKS